MNFIPVYVFHKGNIAMVEGFQREKEVRVNPFLVMGTERICEILILLGLPAVFSFLDVDALMDEACCGDEIVMHFHVSGYLALQILGRGHCHSLYVH